MKEETKMYEPHCELNETFIHHEPCPKCHSRDNLARYADGHGHCFGCGHHEKAINGEHTLAKALANTNGSKFVTDLTYQSLRGISEKTCRLYGYGMGEYDGEKCHVISFTDSVGNIVAQKLRFKGKRFKWIGDASKADCFFGKNLHSKGKKLNLFESELDAMSMFEALGRKFACVSVVHGASGASKDVQRELEYINNFDEVIFIFDNDRAGKEGANKCCPLLPVGKAKVASLPLKDANEMLQAGRVDELINSVWEAKVYRPDGIVAVQDTWDYIVRDYNVDSVSYPWEEMNQRIHGARTGEIVMFCAGTGVGKSTVCREVAYSFIKRGEPLGYIALEEPIRKTLLSFLSIESNQILHLKPMDQAKLKELFDSTLKKYQLYLYDHFGSLDNNNLINKIRYLVTGCGVKWIVLDHISIVVSGIETGDERRIIDNTMTKLRSLCEELKVGMFIVSHLKYSGGEGFEHGEEIKLDHLRGSGSLKQLADIVIGLERDTQSDDNNNKDQMKIRILKNRFSGDTGESGVLKYDGDTGRITSNNEIMELTDEIPF